MQSFRIRKKGTHRFTNILARNPVEATRKFILLVESKRMLTVNNPQVSTTKSKKLFRGAK